MKVFQSALVSKIAGSAFNTAIGGRFYFYQAPQLPTYPCSVYYIIDDSHTYYMQGTRQYEELLLQINIFSNTSSSSELGDIFENVKSLFDNCTLTVTGYNSISFTREFSYIDRDPEAQLWAIAIQYRVLLQKS